MVTKIKPRRIKSDNPGSLGDFLGYQDEATFQWGQGGGGQVYTAGRGIGIENNEINARVGTGLTIGDYQDYSAIKGPCPEGFHIPTRDEAAEFSSMCSTLGVSAYTHLFFPYESSHINRDGVMDPSINGSYWTCNNYTDANFYMASMIWMRSGGQPSVMSQHCTCGLSIRPFKDVVVIPDNTWTMILDGSSIANNAGVFYNSDLGVLSISSDGVNWITIADKNLGATQVYHDGDTLSDANRGLYYQFGNNHGFSIDLGYTTSSTKVDTTGYGPGNFYDDDVFITTGFGERWSSVKNPDIWGGVTGVVTQTNTILNTGVLSVNGQTGDVTIPTAEESNTKTFYLSSTLDLTTAQAAIDWITAGKTAFILFNGAVYKQRNRDTSGGNERFFFSTDDNKTVQNTNLGNTVISHLELQINADETTHIVSTISTSEKYLGKYINIDGTYSEAFTPTQDYHPATKKYVDDNIAELMGLGKFLSLRDSSTGQPISFPYTTPYAYSTGDYFLVEVVDTTTNYRPNGSSYTGTASSTAETDELEVGDVYVYDGSVWLLQSNHGKTVSFGNIAGDPYDNTNLGNALNAKQNVLTAGTNIQINGNTISATDTKYNTATSTVSGTVKLGNDTAITDTIAQPGTATGKTYPVQLNSSGQMGVNVPRANTTYGSGTGINIDANNNIQNTGVTSFNGNTGAVTYTAPVTSVNGQTGAVTVTDTTYTAGTGIEIKNGPDYSAMQGPAPTGYHIPSNTERQTIVTELANLGWNNTVGETLEEALLMPMAGYRDYSSSSVINAGSYGDYWSSTAHSAGNAYHLGFHSSSLYPQGGDHRSYGFSVRCFKDFPTIPTDSWTVIDDGSEAVTPAEGAGIYHNPTLGVISISSDGVNWITIMDKNLGATTVFNYGDTVTDANCGYFYQWGNNYGFPHSGTVTTSSTQVDASGYGPGNYYNSSTFITSNADWSSVQNDNLWGGATGVVTLNNAITNTGVLSVNGQTGNIAGMIQNDTTGTTTTVTAIRAGSEVEYNTLQTHSANIIYHIY